MSYLVIVAVLLLSLLLLFLQWRGWSKQISFKSAREMYLGNWGECSLYFKLFLMVGSFFTQTPLLCVAVLQSQFVPWCSRSQWEKFHWAWLGLAPLPHLWALLTGSACIILFIFCCFWLATWWESTCELLSDGSKTGTCASAGSVAEALAIRLKWRTQLCSSGVIHSSFQGLELSLEMSEHENLNCDFTCTSGYFSWCS